MLKFVFRTILLGLLVWLLSPVLDLLPSLPTEGMVEGFLDLSKEKDRFALDLFKSIFWMVILGVLIKYGLPIFNFIYPAAKRYSTTKLYRRFQSIFSGLITFIVVFVSVNLLIAAVMFYYYDSGINKLLNPELTIVNQDFQSIYEAYGVQSFIAAIVFLLFMFGFAKDEFGKAYEQLIQFLERGRFGLGGSSRFAGLLEEWPYNFESNKNSLFMGRSLYNPFRHIGLKDERHILTIAGSRAGKGATSIIPNLLLWEGSTLVIDPKGTNAAVTARRREKLSGEENVHIIDPFNVSGDKGDATFNPLEFLDPKSSNIREQINVIAEALVVPDEGQKEKHWDDGARTVIAGMIGHLVSSDKYENPNLFMLRDMISMLPEEQIELWADMSLNEGAGRLAKDAANRIIRGINTNEISSIISNADKHTEWLSSPAIQKTLQSSSFKFSDLKEKPTTIYLVLPPQYLQTHNRFLRLFVNLVINQMSIGGKSKVPVLLLMDEFLALGRMEEVEKAFGLMAGYNLVMWPFVQDFGRLKDLYKNSVNAFIANSRAVQVFGIGDEETKEFVSNYIGDRALETSAKINHHRNIAKLRTPSEVAIDTAAHTRRQYILRSGRAPFILEKVPYYDDAPIDFLKSLFGKDFMTGPFKNLYEPDSDYTQD